MDKQNCIRRNEEPLLRREMPELDSIRGIAILMVVLYHGLYWQVDLSHFPRAVRLFLTLMWTGRLGVNLFFVLSGFLITGILVDSRTRTDYYRRFYVRRALRILPAYLVILCVLLLTHYSSKAFVFLSFFYLSNLTPLFGITLSYPVLWSLAVEEHFYLLWPAFVRYLGATALGVLSLLIVALSPIARLLSFPHSISHGIANYACNDYTWNSLDGLACGAILALIVRHSKISRYRLLGFAGAFLGFSILIWMIGIPHGILTRQTAFGASLQVVPWHFAFTGVLGCALLLGSSRYKWIVDSRFLGFFGAISYGLYLIHVLIFALYDHIATSISITTAVTLPLLFLRLVIAGGISVLIAYISRRLFEERFLQLKDRLS